MTSTIRLLLSFSALTLISACATAPEVSTGTSINPPDERVSAEVKRTETVPATASAVPTPTPTVTAPPEKPAATPQADGKGSQALAAGLREYENGKYEAATKTLRSAIVLGLSTRDLVNAYKHLAFIHCISDRRSACQAEFSKALRINPQLELSAAEAGHPSWGPVFASEKAKLKTLPKSSGSKPVPTK